MNLINILLGSIFGSLIHRFRAKSPRGPCFESWSEHSRNVWIKRDRTRRRVKFTPPLSAALFSNQWEKKTTTTKQTAPLCADSSGAYLCAGPTEWRACRTRPSPRWRRPARTRRRSRCAGDRPECAPARSSPCPRRGRTCRRRPRRAACRRATSSTRTPRSSGPWASWTCCRRRASPTPDLFRQENNIFPISSTRQPTISNQQTTSSYYSPIHSLL